MSEHTYAELTEHLGKAREKHKAPCDECRRFREPPDESFRKCMLVLRGYAVCTDWEPK